MDILDIVLKAVVITFFIYGVVSFIYNVRDERARRKTVAKQRPAKKQFDLNPTEFPISAYTEQKGAPRWPSFPPRSSEEMELS